jgi:hypothetical protein
MSVAPTSQIPTVLTADWKKQEVRSKPLCIAKVTANGEGMKASPLAVFLTIVVILIVGTSLCTFLNPPFTLPPQGGFSHCQKATNTTEIVYFDVIYPDTKPSDFKIVIGSDDWSVDYDMPSNDSSGSLALVHIRGVSCSNNIGSVVYTDKAQDKTISDGDYLTITLGHEGSGSEVYGVYMVHIPSGFLDYIFFTW